MAAASYIVQMGVGVQRLRSLHDCKQDSRSDRKVVVAGQIMSPH